MKHISYGRAAASLAVGALLLSACGGRGDSIALPTDPPVAGSEVPTSATTSSAGALTFVKSVAATSSDSATPLVVGDAVLATSETEEPDPSV